MKGVQFVINDAGKKTAAIIDLEEWGELWEDISDLLISESRKKEPTIPWDQLKKEMEKESQGQHCV